MPRTLKHFIESHTGVDESQSLLAVARTILHAGVLTLTHATATFNEASGADGRQWRNALCFLEHLLRHLPLLAFASARKSGWMLVERTTDFFPVLAQLVQSVTTLQTALDVQSQLSADSYRAVEQLMDAQQ